MPLVINYLSKQEDRVISMGKRKTEDIPPPAVPQADVKEKSIKEAATTPPVVETVKKSPKVPSQKK